MRADQAALAAAQQSSRADTALRENAYLQERVSLVNQENSTLRLELASSQTGAVMLQERYRQMVA